LGDQRDLSFPLRDFDAVVEAHGARAHGSGGGGFDVERDVLAHAAAAATSEAGAHIAAVIGVAGLNEIAGGSALIDPHIESHFGSDAVAGFDEVAGEVVRPGGPGCGERGDARGVAGIALPLASAIDWRRARLR